MTGSYIMFHWVRGIPFDFNAGAFDNLNMWEQIDNGDQYTPAKKYLLSVPIILFLVSTHYTHYDIVYFLINLLATVAVVIPKLPAVRTSALARTALTRTDPPLTTEPLYRSAGRPLGRHLLYFGCMVTEFSGSFDRRTSYGKISNCIWLVLGVG